VRSHAHFLFIIILSLLTDRIGSSERKDILDNPQANDDAFDVAVEDAISDHPHPAKRRKGPGGDAKLPRQARDKKYGFGGAGKRSKQNTKASTDDFNMASGRRGKGGFRGGGRGGGSGGRGGGTKRLGKSRRIAARSKA
jgi:rRNA-processing protein EBP2